MEQITIRETMFEAKINELNERIKELETENFNLKQIIMWQSFDRSGIKKDPKTLTFKPSGKGKGSQNECKRND